MLEDFCLFCYFSKRRLLWQPLESLPRTSNTIDAAKEDTQWVKLLVHKQEDLLHALIQYQVRHGSSPVIPAHIEGHRRRRQENPNKMSDHPAWYIHQQTGDSVSNKVEWQYGHSRFSSDFHIHVVTHTYLHILSLIHACTYTN